MNGYRAHCWRTENHRNGDADPSIRFHKVMNKGRCFVCDAHTWSNIDLVMLFRECDLRSAIQWITARFSVPQLAKGSHIEKREAWSPRFRAGDADTVVETLVRSFLWSDLSHSERSILPVLATFTDRSSGMAEISYRGLMRYSGVGSQATIAQALRHFQQMKLLEVIRTPGLRPLRRVNQYRFTFDDPEFQAMVTKVLQRQRAEIELEKQLREEERQTRKDKYLPV